MLNIIDRSNFIRPKGCVKVVPHADVSWIDNLTKWKPAFEIPAIASNHPALLGQKYPGVDIPYILSISWGVKYEGRSVEGYNL